MIFGKPMEFSRYYGRETDREALRAVTDEIMAEIVKLSGQEYVNIYAKRAKERLRAEEPDTAIIDAQRLHRWHFPAAHCKSAYGRLGFALCEWECLPAAATARD